MAKQSIQRLAEERLDAAARASAASLDLQLDLLDERDDSKLARFGGLWNRHVKDYMPKDAVTSRRIRLHPGQLDAAEFFLDWLDGHLAGDVEPEDRIFDLAFTGGRRGGKSALAFTLAVAYALACPGSIVWIVTPSDAFFTEPMEYLESIMPREWYTSLGWPHWTYFLANGSSIQLHSGHTPRRLKQGRADFVVINEGQAVPSQSYTTLSASIVDQGGLVLTAANPPDVGDPGEWVADLVGGIESGEVIHGVHFFFDPLKNPHIDQAALAALAEKMDPHTFDVQVRGMYKLPPDAVLHTWDRLKNEMPVPDEKLGLDVTRAFTKHYEGRAYDDIIGGDVQTFPWIAAVRTRVYRNPKAPDDLSKALLWGVGESYIEQGDEIDTARDLKAQGVDPERTLMIMDASCDWQQQQRDQTKQRPEFRGAGSMDMMRGEGFKHVVPPDPDMRDNPSVVDRMRAANARIGPKVGEPLVFVDPRRCPKTVVGIRKWKTVKGKPARWSKHAHGGDAFTYIIWRFFPRRTERGNVDVQAIKRFAGPSRVKGFT